MTTPPRAPSAPASPSDTVESQQTPRSGRLSRERMVAALRTLRRSLLYPRLTFALPRLRTLMIPVVGLLATLFVLAPAAAADGAGDYKPGGIGDMMPSPFRPPGQGTLFETYDPDVYTLDKQLSDDLTGGDLIDGWMHGLGNILMGLLTLVGRGTVVVVGWVFNVTSLPEIEKPLAQAIGAAAEPMMQMFLPTAVAVGGFLAWAKRSQTSPLGQLAWVAASAAIATTFLIAPATWIKGVDNGRQLGADVAMTSISGGLAGDTNSAMPFKTPTPAWSDNEKDNTVRKAGDAVWRTYVATPWCVANLGSINACKKWGAEVVKRGTDMDKREDFLKNTLTTDAVGSEAVQWRQGHTPGGRLTVIIAAIISCVIFAALCLSLAFATLGSLLGALMLLVCGVVFATLWCIPGKPRQWGVQWFETLVGLVLVSFTGTMCLGAVLVVSTATQGMLPDYGWLMVSALNCVCAAMGMQVKGRLDGIVSAGGAQMTGRGALSAVSRWGRARRLRRAVGRLGRRGRGGGMGDMDRHPAPDDESTPGSGSGSGSGSGGGSGPTRPTRTPPSRTYPPPPSHQLPSANPPAAGTPSAPGGPTGPAGTGPSGRRSRTGSGPGGRGPGRTGGPGGAGTTTTAGGYTVRPGAMRRPGPPPPRPSSSGRVVTGTVINRSAGSTGSPSPAASRRPYTPPAPGPPRPAGLTPARPGGLPRAGGTRGGPALPRRSS
ncbi:hypothetical protein [Streptomyces europaeiscabiei]|uniref:hypothetical protein n=1 Tax=Streptomyces europaeiscabiei TaxID=146819 RepID=UPI0038F66B8B